MDRSIEDKPEVIVKVDDLLLWVKVMMMIDSVIEGPATRFNGLHVQGPRWVFRGQADAKWPIKSSYEHEILDKIPHSEIFTEAELFARERSMLQRFKQIDRGKIDVTPQTDGEWMSLLQHYGCPTRLVDFTLSPLIALYFAINAKNVDVPNQDFAVWAVRNKFHKSFVDEKNCNFLTPIHNANDIMQLKNRGKRTIDISETIENCLAFDESNNRFAEKLFRGDVEAFEPRILTYRPNILNRRMLDQDALFLMVSNLTCHFMEILRKEFNLMGVKPVEMELQEIVKDNKFCEEIANAQLIEFKFERGLVKEVKTLLHISNITHRFLFDDVEGWVKECKDIAKSLYKCDNA